MTNSEMPQQDKKLTTKSDAGVKRDRAIDASDAGLDKVLWVTSNFQKISSPIVCTLLVTALLILAVGVVYYAPNLALFGFMALMAYAGALSAISRLRGARLLSRWNVMRFARGVRKSFAASPVALALYAICFFLAALAGGTLVLTQSPVVFTLFGVAIGVVLSVATICDWYARLKYVLSISALRQFVKLVVAFLATATVFLSAVIAKQLTHSITLADPASMPEFVRLVSTFVFPFAFSAVLSVALSVLMISQYLVLLVGMIIAIPTRYSLAIFSPRRGNLNGIGYRILNGRRPLKSRPCWDRIVDGVQHFLRPVGTGAVAALVLLFGNALVNLTGLIPDKYVQTLLVKTEYRNPHLCENVMNSAHIVYLAGGYVSVAMRNLDGYKFSVEKCHK